MKKLYVLSLPLLAVVAFAIASATASAVTSYGTCQELAATSTNCPAGEKFHEFPEFEHIGVDTREVSKAFVLENEAKTAGIECTSLEDIGYFFNILNAAGTAEVGHSNEVLLFDSCKGTGALAACEINPKTNHEIEGTVTNEVVKENEVKITITSGFNVKCKEGTEEKEEGGVTGSATGTQTVKTNVLKFAKATGLTFAMAPATITGEVEAFTLQGKKVYI
jgi:hypothetical protein